MRQAPYIKTINHCTNLPTELSHQLSMHKFPLSVSELTLDPRNQRQPLPPPPPFVVMQYLQANNIPWCESFYGLPCCACPVYQRQLQHQYPSSGPSRNQRNKGSRKAEALYLNTSLHESSGTIAGDRPAGIHPGHAQIGAIDKTGTGKV